MEEKEQMQMDWSYPYPCLLHLADCSKEIGDVTSFYACWDVGTIKVLFLQLSYHLHFLSFLLL